LTKIAAGCNVTLPMASLSLGINMYALDDFFMRRLLPQPNRYQHCEKVHRNLYNILAIASAFDELEIFLKEKLKLPEKSGIVEHYPRPEKIVLDYAFLLKETLIESAVFIRGHDEFWKNLEGMGWSDVSTRKCGISFYTEGEPKRKELGLRDACDKLIHHTHFDIGNCGNPARFTVDLCGTEREKKWRAYLDVIEFCWIGLTYIG